MKLTYYRDDKCGREKRGDPTFTYLCLNRKCETEKKMVKYPLEKSFLDLKKDRKINTKLKLTVKHILI